MNRQRNELLEFRKVIEKALTGDDEAVVAKQRINDIVVILKEYAMTMDLLKETNFGSALKKVMDKYPEDEVSLNAKKILQKWKKTLTNTKSATTPTSSQGNSKNPEILEDDAATCATATTGSLSLQRSITTDTDLTWGDEDMYEGLNDVRGKVRISTKELYFEILILFALAVYGTIYQFIETKYCRINGEVHCFQY
jgi:hypothetical protein